MVIERILPHQEILEKYGLPEVRDSDFVTKGQLDVYLPRSSKMSVLLGNPESRVAIATGWGDPWFAIQKADVEKFSILASLRTPYGIDIMLHNLARNPQIRRVVVYANGVNDGTEAGLFPQKVVKAAFSQGIADNGEIIGTGISLVPELVEDGALEVVRKVLKNVELVDLSSVEEAKLGEVVQSLSPVAGPYMEKAVLPEFKVREVATWPSERTGMVFRERDAFAGWLSLMAAIMRYGQDGLLETAGTTVRELPYVRVVVTGSEPFGEIPDWAGKLKEIKVSKESLEEYYKRFFRPERYQQEVFPGVRKFVRPTHDKYLYAELLWAFPRPAWFDDRVVQMARNKGSGKVFEFLSGHRLLEQGVQEKTDEVLAAPLSETDKAKILLEILQPPVNQVENVINRIKKSPDDADKTLILWDPTVHGVQDRGRPCLVEIAMLVRDRKIDAKAVYRSHDVPKGWIFNEYGVRRILEDVCLATGYESGQVIAESESAHAYLGDLNWVGDLWKREVLGKEPQRVFRHETGDPRGDISISVVGKEIICLLKDPVSSQPIAEFRSENRKELVAQLNQLGLISQTSHALDVGGQLLAAELAMKLGIPFTQDQEYKVLAQVRQKFTSGQVS